MMKKILITALIFILSLSTSFAVTVESYGEAEIINGDIPTAKNMAISRGKWSALEKVSGVKIKLDTIIHNSILADEAVKSELSGTIKSFVITDEGKDGNIYWVAVKADIVPDKAGAVVDGLSKNTSIAVILPAVHTDGEVVVDNPVNTGVINGLKDKGFDVIDISSLESDIIALMDNAIKTNNYDKVYERINKYMASTLLIGKINVIPMGNDIGYGKVDFSILSGELSWKLVGDKAGSKVVLTSGSIVGRGQGATDKDGAYNLFRSMSKSGGLKIVSAVSQKILGDNAKIIRVAVNGKTNPRILKELREDIKNIPFVLDVREEGLGAVSVNYPEKTYYLVSFLTKNGKYNIIRMDNDEIIVERR